METKKYEKKCPQCLVSKPFREFWGKEYRDSVKDVPVLYLAVNCNSCAGIKAVEDLTRAKQLYYSYIESLISISADGRLNVCKAEHLALKGGISKSKVKQDLIRKGLNPTDEAVETAWYKLRTDKLRRILRRAEQRPEGDRRAASRKPGYKRGDYKQWLKED